MKHLMVYLVLWSWATGAYSQATPQLAFFEHLTQDKWEMNGDWGNGKKFRQIQVYSWGLNKRIVKVQTFGTTDPKTGAFGLRNEGIRAWDATKKQVVFWEFDVFGGITQGTCTVEGNFLYYDYTYQGQSFRDSWQKISPNAYAYKVGTYKDGRWLKVFLSATYKRMTK
ncbi:hypothetical protein [Microscilla marina]|uniref:Lipoprotein n=1 Tax=Microscilla marina ATCC 23134 TaxID=313606 RepID=A1ZDC8_MICM2|nr:hypothetical protein [Microscilla marina]EAY31667.1 hypothetical protein M23134_05173 [Microscilla marina ATCC 23134]